jgi:hypothetical protein
VHLFRNPAHANNTGVMRSQCANVLGRGGFGLPGQDAVTPRGLTRRAVAPVLAGTIAIPAGGLVALPGKAPRVDCVEGTVWVTQAGDERDVILRAGMTFAARGRGQVVVQAVDGAARVRVG